MAVPRRHGFHVRNVGLAGDVAGQEFRKLPHAIALRASRQHHLPEIEIGDELRDLKTKLRVLEPRLALKPFVTPDPFQASVAQRSFRILVVDDEPDIRMMAVLAIKQDQHQVIEASSGPEALRMIDEQMPDLVVMDFKMPGMDGMEVVRTLRAKPETARLPILMLTAMADEASTRAGFAAGVTDYVAKPFSIPQLTARVRACLARTAIG